MIPKNRIPAHPGEILQAEFLEPAGISQTQLAEHINVPLQRINTLIAGRRGVTTDTARRLAMALGTTPELWMNLQSSHDLAVSSYRVELSITAILVQGPERATRKPSTPTPMQTPAAPPSKSRSVSKA